MESLSFLKQWDMFASPIYLNIKRGHKKKHYDSDYGTFFGFTMTLISQALCLAYLGHLITRMY